MSQEGFYKKDNNQIIYSQNTVEGNGYVLFLEEKDTYEFPIDGWIYASSIDDAIQRFSNIYETANLDFKQKINNGFLVMPENFILGIQDSDRIMFSQMIILVKEALDLGLITNETPQSIKDVANQIQIISTLRFRQIMVEYGFYYKTLWNNYIS